MTKEGETIEQEDDQTQVIEDSDEEVARKGKEVVVIEPQTVLLPADPQLAAMQIISDAARNPAVDVDKMEKLIAMREHVEAYEAEKLFWRAFPAMQGSLPTIPKKGVMHQRNKAGTKEWDIPFSKFEDVIEYIRPILKKHGFALSFKHTQLENGKLRTIGMLSHRGGHVERDNFDADHDDSGSKNAIQAIGSTRAYGKRYTTGSLLGLAFGGEDDDGASAGRDDSPRVQSNPKSVGNLANEAMVKTLRRACENKGLDESMLCEQVSEGKVSRFENMPSNRVNEILDLIKAQKDPSNG